MGIRHTHLGAGQPVKHPGRNLQPTVRIGTAQAAAKNSATRPLDRRVNADPKTKPRMPWVQQFSKLGSVGVLKLCCTTAIGLIRALTDARPIKPASTRCLSARRPNPGRGSTYRRGNPVQTTAATSVQPAPAQRVTSTAGGEAARDSVGLNARKWILELKCILMKMTQEGRVR
jgi:hypothetical protein